MHTGELISKVLALSDRCEIGLPRRSPAIGRNYRCPRIEIKRRISTYHLGNEKVSLVLDQAKASLEMEDEREQEDEGEMEERE